MKNFSFLQQPRITHDDLSALKRIADLKDLPGLKKTKMVMYSITSKLNSTFGTICKATADKITAKVVGNSSFCFSVKTD